MYEFEVNVANPPLPLPFNALKDQELEAYIQEQESEAEIHSI